MATACLAEIEKPIWNDWLEIGDFRKRVFVESEIKFRA